jgi:hypothetical protein
MLHTKLGIQHDDLTRMGPGIAGVYDKWRVEHNMNHYFVDPEARVQVMPSHQSPPTMSPRSPSSLSSHATGTMHLGQAQPATPMSQPGESSTATSPVNPSFQMPGQPPFFTSSPQWATAPHLTRGYDPEWDRGYAHTLANPMAHNPNPHPHIAVQTEFVNPEFQTPGPSRGPGAGSAPFTPATPVPQRGHNMAGPPGVPLYYNPQLQQPQPAQQTAQPQQPAPQAPATGPGSPPQTGSSPKPIDPFVMHQQRQ